MWTCHEYHEVPDGETSGGHRQTQQPCGVAYGSSLADAYEKANMADRIAASAGPSFSTDLSIGPQRS